MHLSEKELAEARAICTKAEMQLLQSSHGPLLEQADQARLKKKVTLARELRDKWRDQFESQRRGSQQSTGMRVNEQNQRSEEKVQIFAGALARFEEQLAKVVANPTAKKGVARSKPIKAQRVRSHRASRSEARGALKELKAEVTAAAKPAAKKSAAPSAATSTPAAASVKAAATKKKAVAKKAVKKAAVKGRVVATRKSSAPSTPVAKAAAKKNRLKVSGKTTRVPAHTSAAGKRNQARRDAKKK